MVTPPLRAGALCRCLSELWRSRARERQECSEDGAATSIVARSQCVALQLATAHHTAAVGRGEDQVPELQPRPYGAGL